MEVFINVSELNDNDVAITVTDEDGIFIDELGDDLLSTSLEDLEKKIDDLGFILDYEDINDLSYYMGNFKEYLYNKNHPYEIYADDDDNEPQLSLWGTFRGFLRKRL